MHTVGSTWALLRYATVEDAIVACGAMTAMVANPDLRFTWAKSELRGGIAWAEWVAFAAGQMTASASSASA